MTGQVCTACRRSSQSQGICRECRAVIRGWLAPFRARYTYAQAAALLDVSEKTIGRWYCGETQPGRASRRRIWPIVRALVYTQTRAAVRLAIADVVGPGFYSAQGREVLAVRLDMTSEAIATWWTGRSQPWPATWIRLQTSARADGDLLSRCLKCTDMAEAGKSRCPRHAEQNRRAVARYADRAKARLAG